MTLVLSFDFGTGGVRAGLFDADRRDMIATAEESYPTEFPKPGWAEQSPLKWLDAMEIACRAVLSAAGRTEVAAVCVATTASTVVAATRRGAPLRPAILWMDCRASEEAQATTNSDHPAMDYCGGSDAVEWLVPKAMWLSRNEPEIYATADVVCEALDYVNHHLTGLWVGSRMNAACKWNYDSANSTFLPEIYESFGVPDLTDKLPQHIVPVGGTIGPMQAEIASRLGLTGKPPLVAQGGIDAHIGILGAGTVEEGGMLMIGGTSVVQLVQLGAKADMNGFWGPYPNALIDDLWLVEAGQVSAGSILSWLSDTIFGLDEKGHTELIAAAMERRAGASGLLTLDFWMGNRTPYRDGDLRGAIMGLSLGHGRADIYASAVDGIALGSANIIAVLEQRGVKLDRIVVAGGICKNPLWLQSSIEAIGKPVDVVESENLTLTGAAICSLTALGHYPDLRVSAAELAVTGRQVSPDPAGVAWFQEQLGVYRETTSTLTPTFHQLTASQLGKMEPAQ